MTVPYFQQSSVLVIIFKQQRNQEQAIPGGENGLRAPRAIVVNKVIGARGRGVTLQELLGVTFHCPPQD